MPTKKNALLIIAVPDELELGDDEKSALSKHINAINNALSRFLKHPKRRLLPTTRDIALNREEKCLDSKTLDTIAEIETAIQQLTDPAITKSVFIENIERICEIGGNLLSHNATKNNLLNPLVDLEVMRRKFMDPSPSEKMKKS